MQKAFELAALKERLAAKGIDLAEDLLKVLVGETLDWTQDSLAMHENAYVKFMAPVISTVKPLVLAEVDKIDGKVG